MTLDLSLVDSLSNRTTVYEKLSRLAKAWPPTQSFHGANLSALRNAAGEPLYATASASAFAAATSAASNAKRSEKRQGGMRVMIVGDSMSQGQHGDFTWRYRISQWFQSNGIAVSFVGPYTGTVEAPAANPGPPTPPRLASQGQAPPVPGTFDGPYAAGAVFDSDHFAAWGYPLAYAKGSIYNTMIAHMPDMILLMLGFNDMGWFYSDAPGTLESMNTFIGEARRANPNIKLAIANVPQRSFIGGRQDLVDNTALYNSLLAAQIPKWSTAQSPISLVHLQENYQCAPAACPAGYDGLHPNESGEYQIARAFSLSLYGDFKLGHGPLQIPANIPPRAMTQQVPAAFNVFPSPQGVTATWTPVPGAYSYDVQSTITAPDGGVLSWNWSPQSVQSNRWDTQWSSTGWTYTVQVRASAGDTRKGPWSAPIAAAAKPQLAAAPSNVVAHPTTNGVDITWDPPTGPYSDSVVEYNVIYYDIDSCNFLTGAAFKSSPAQIDGFVPGHHVFMAIVTWNANGQGWPNILPEVMAGFGTPGAPQAPHVQVFDPTSVHLTWNDIQGATGYAIWMRNVNDKKSISTRLNGTVPVACDNIYFLFPGAWNYEFCISAYNGNYESAKGGCTVGQKTTISTAGPTCPLGPQWCSGQQPGGSKSSPPSSPPSDPNPPLPSQSSTPPSSGGNPNLQEGYPNADWYQFTCHSPGVTDASRNPQTQWTAAKTDSAWATVNAAWKSSKKTIPYVAYVSNFFHGPPGMACQTTTTQNGCEMDIVCTDPTKAGGYFIINSFINSAIILEDIHQSIQNAKSGVALSADAFATTFATYDGSQEQLLQILLDLVAFGFGVVLTPIWATFLKQGAWGLANKAGADIIKDETNNFVGSAARFGKDFKPSISQSEIDTKIELFSGQTLDTWAEMVTGFQNYLFSGSDDAIDDLYSMISLGKMLDITNSLATDDTVDHFVREVLWATMLPVAWYQSTAHEFAVIVDSGAPCGTQNPLHQYVPDDVAAQNFACVDNTIYYLLGGPINTPETCVGGGFHSAPDCKPTPLQALNGVAALSPGNTDWEGLTVPELITGAVNTFKWAGNKNGAPEPDGTDPALLSAIYDQNIEAPGTVILPVCGITEIYNNWEQKSNSKNFPCN